MPTNPAPQAAPKAEHPAQDVKKSEGGLFAAIGKWFKSLFSNSEEETEKEQEEKKAAQSAAITVVITTTVAEAITNVVVTTLVINALQTLKRKKINTNT